MARLAIFIDGGYVDALAEDEFDIRVDYKKLSEAIVREVASRTPESVDLLRTYYYHCLPYQSNPPTAEEAARFSRTRSFFDALARLSVADQRALDQILIRTERALTREDGLPGRPWFTHQIYAPGFYTGYGVKTIPGVREAIEQRDWPLATTQIDLAADTLALFADQVDRATGILTGSR